MHFRKKATIVKNKIHQSVLHHSFPSAESLPKEFWKDFFNWKKGKKKVLFALYIERMTKTSLKRKWMQKMTKHDLIYFHFLFLTAYVSHSLNCVLKNPILLDNISGNTNVNQESSIRLQ